MGRALLALIPAVSAALFFRGTFDVFFTPKLLAVVLGASALAGLGVAARLRGHHLVVPRTLACSAAAGFALIAVLATATSNAPLRSIMGASAAHAGLALYLSCVVIFFAAATVFRDHSPVATVGTLLVTAVPVVGYGAAQALQLDPLSWRLTAGGPAVFSTLGNPNFFSAWSGIVIVLAAWGAWSSTWSTQRRVACGVLGLAALAVAWASASVQGPLAALAGLAVLAAARLSDHGRHRAGARRRTLALFFLPVIVLIGAAVVLLTRGDAVTSIASRVGKWEAALAMARARPLTGFGLDQFGDWYHAYRPLSEAVRRGLASTADAAHSVVLQLLAGGGVPLATAYVLFVAAIGVTAWRAVRGAHGERRLLLGALAGAWVAYQVQAAVSIDVPPLAVLHWTLAGLVVAVATPGGLLRHHLPHGPWSITGALAATLAACLVVGAVSVPLRADVAARRALLLGTQNRHASAERAFGIALRLNPVDPRYPLALARERLERGDTRPALDAYRLALARAPRSLPTTLESARVAASAGRHDEAAEQYLAAVALDPQSPHLLVEAARALLRTDRAHDAIPLLERAVVVTPRDRWQNLLDRARAAVPVGAAPAGQAAGSA